MANNKSKNGGGPRDVLFYGDSLTWGMAHNYTGRYANTFPRMLESSLMEAGWRMVEAALCSRTSCFDDDANKTWMIGGEPHIFNGLAHFPSTFLGKSCRAVVFLLGTNDLKTVIRSRAKQRTRIDANTIAANVARLGHLARRLHDETPRLENHPFDIIFVCPPPVRLNPLSQQLGYDDSSVKISLEFPEAFEEMCRVNNFLLVPAPQVDMSRSVDGVHLTPEGTRLLADAVWSVLRPVLGITATTTITEQPLVLETTSLKRRKQVAAATAVSTATQKPALLSVLSAVPPPIIKRPPTPVPTSMSSKRLRRDSPVMNNHRPPSPTATMRSKCTLCQKYRMRTSKNSRWKTCDDGFWVSPVDEWKTGCGWDEDMNAAGNDSDTSVSSSLVSRGSAGGRGDSVAHQLKSSSSSAVAGNITTALGSGNNNKPKLSGTTLTTSKRNNGNSHNSMGR